MANTNRSFVRDDILGLGVQMDELNLASTMQDDFDLAYRLQLEEALSASRHEGHNHNSSHLLDSAPASPEDRSLAFALQNFELSRSQQQASDLYQVTLESERLEQELRLRAHDVRFAQSLHELNDSDWDSHGDLCEDPFQPNCQDDSLFKAYVTSVFSGDGPMAPGAVGVVVMDEHDVVLTEVRKPLDLGVGRSGADYMALIAGLETLFSLRLQHAEAFTDSVLIYNQVTQRWKVRSHKLQGLCAQVVDLVRKFEQFQLKLIPRYENNLAVRVAREALHVRAGLGASSVDRDAATDVKELCPICLEGKGQAEMFHVGGCSHGFCQSCIVQHAEVKVQEGKVPVHCPHLGCTQTLSIEQCHAILSEKWFVLLNKRLIEVNMPECDRVYCPFPNCSALMNRNDCSKLLNRNDLLASNRGASSSSSSPSRPTRCVDCLRLFCVECRVPWHTSMSCQEYQQLPLHLRDAQDAKLHQLAEHQKWKRCKKCRRMIELAEGCYHMTCRCGYEFCYLCGEPWKNNSQSCKCRLWDEDYLLNEPLNESEDNEDDWNGPDEGYEDSEDFDELNNRFILEVQAPAASNNPYYKTRLCKYWEMGCHWGADCKFAHGVHELRSFRSFLI